MGKKDHIVQLTNLMSRALRHRIGSIVNEDELYAAKYAKDAEIILDEAERISHKQNWNSYDKKEIREKLKKKLEKELAEKDFIGNKKFEIIDEELKKALDELDLS